MLSGMCLYMHLLAATTISSTIMLMNNYHHYSRMFSQSHVFIPTLKCHAVQHHKRAHYGCLPSKMRRVLYKATMEGCGFITTRSTLQADHEQLVPGMVQHDFDLNQG